MTQSLLIGGELTWEFSCFSCWNPFPRGSAHVSVRTHPTFAPQALCTRAQGQSRGAWEARDPLKQWWEWTGRANMCRYTSAPGKYVEPVRIKPHSTDTVMHLGNEICAYVPQITQVQLVKSTPQSFRRPTYNFDSWSLIKNSPFVLCLLSSWIPYVLFQFRRSETIPWGTYLEFHS